MNDKELAAVFKIWEPLVKRSKPPTDETELAEIHFWLRDADQEDLWKAMRSVYLRGKEERPF